MKFFILILFSIALSSSLKSQIVSFSYDQKGNKVKKINNGINILGGPLNLTQSSCNDNGTSGNASDDYFTVTIHPGNSNSQLGSYSISGDLIYNNIPYNASFVMTITTGTSSWNITLTDDEDSYCSTTITITPPSGCVEPCPTEYSTANSNMLTGTQGNNFDFEAGVLIQSDQVINMNAVVDYDAGNSIDLLPGFETKLGVKFHAFIDGCGNLFMSDEEITGNRQ